MRGINKAIIVGTLGQDPELRHGSSGVAIVNLSVATNEAWKDKDGQQQERTEWHRVVMFGKVAEIANQYLQKGSPAYFEGRLQTRKWQDNNGNDRWSTEIVAHDMQLLGSKPSGTRPAPQQEQKPSQEAPKQEDGFDDIPF